MFVVPIENIPRGLPTDANARSQNTRTRVAQKIRDSLFDLECEPSTFHLKNNGITIIAEKVQKSKKEDDLFRVEILEGQGIIDGGHTYKIITESLDAQEPPPTQFVNVEVLTGVDNTWIPDISGGRNTTVQVAPMSLGNLKGEFDWMKHELATEPYIDQIAWSENDPGQFDARDLIALLSLFNICHYPNDGDTHPTSAYARKAQELARFEDEPELYENMRPIFKEILQLHDTIRCDYYSIWNDQSGGTKAGGLSISEKKKNGRWDFIFTGESAEFRMVNGALYPILGAFRWFVRTHPDTKLAYWRDGFAEVLNAWRKYSVDLLRATNEMNKELGYKPNAIGKSTAHWRGLHQLLAVRDFQGKDS
ncbi:MAG: AIPR family protein [Gammaproteobacteria bacterium]|nr:AIPR family protein [Gammaproteobacteria bacterium]